MKKYPEHIIQICHQNGRKFTNREMIQLSVRAALHFEKIQMQQCDIIGMCVSHSDYVAPLFFGAICAGLCISPSDPSYNVNGLKYVYDLTKPKLMFCDGEIYDKVRQAFDECGLTATKIYTVRNHLEGVPDITEFFEEHCNEMSYVVPPLKEGFEQVAMILCTSGSTGSPKGVQMSHAALLNATTLGVDFAPRLLCYSSFYGSVAIFMLIQSATNCFTRIISENPFSPEEFCDIVKQYQINVSANYPAHIPLLLVSDKLATSDLSSLRLMFIAGKTIPYALMEKFMPFARNCTFRTYYGLTEICGAITSSPIDPSDSVGRMLVNTEAKILNDSGEQLGPNETGEILRVICEIPEVVDACVVGIPDETYDFLAAAGVVRRQGATISEQQIAQFVSERRQDYERLRGGLYFFDSFPLTVTGKTNRKEVTEMCITRRGVEERDKSV
uniref:AMP-binding enzyme n=1 Tax=Musca domestica TaxID=7370 RepID=A0A1I8MJC1_MUSDO